MGAGDRVSETALNISEKLRLYRPYAANRLGGWGAETPFDS
jgi:hypothetical protein